MFNLLSGYAVRGNELGTGICLDPTNSQPTHCLALLHHQWSILLLLNPKFHLCKTFLPTVLILQIGIWKYGRWDAVTARLIEVLIIEARCEHRPRPALMGYASMLLPAATSCATSPIRSLGDLASCPLISHLVPLGETQPSSPTQYPQSGGPIDQSFASDVFDSCNAHYFMAWELSKLQKVFMRTSELDWRNVVFIDVEWTPSLLDL